MVAYAVSVGDFGEEKLMLRVEYNRADVGIWALINEWLRN